MVKNKFRNSVTDKQRIFLCELLETKSHEFIAQLNPVILGIDKQNTVNL